ncbi:hypothetical protein [Shimazuella soli]|uniref:hypothetical protein n=1 Tax=Shimazuella soli TaxID=1892854 RepID=UPI001F10E3E0|nr:hypothetical protein [Shimazuella soli]
MNKRLILLLCISFLLIAEGCSFTKDYPCSCVPPKPPKKEQQSNALEWKKVVWSNKEKV